MNDGNDFERLVADRLADDGSGVVPARRITAHVGAHLDDTRQRPRWLALIKESPMRYESRLAVGSPAARAAAILAATMLMALTLVAAGVAGQRLLAADAVIVVAQDGSGDHETISAAVAAARDGAEIRVRPGTYVENVVVIDKDLTIAGDGDGDRADIVLELDPDAPPADIDWSTLLDPGDDPDVYALLVNGSNVSLSGITVAAPHEGAAIQAFGDGTVLDIADTTVHSLGEIAGGINAVFWLDGSAGSLRDSHIEGWVQVQAAPRVDIERNEMPAVCLGVFADGADVVIRENTIHGCEFEKGIEIEGASTVLIEDNDIMVEDVEPGPSNPNWGGREGIEVFGGGPSVTIRDNVIHDSVVGIKIPSDASVVLEGNRIVDNEEDGITSLPDGAVVSGNTITDNGRRGLNILSGAMTIEGNEVRGNDVGLFLGRRAEPALSGNTICDNGTDVEIVAELESPPDLDGNEVCGETATT